MPKPDAQDGPAAPEAAIASALASAVARDWMRAGAGVLVAVSGGGDSVALLHALVRHGPALGLGRIVAGHVDHGLRPDSAEDARAVVALCEAVGVPCEVRRVTVDREAAGVQAGARVVRYAALEAMREVAGADLVATAHTADDQAETVLMRLCRGTSPAGLSAIRVRSGHVVRPLLGLSRQTLADYGANHGLPVRHDPANDDRRYVRSRVRHRVLPLLEAELGPGVREALSRFAALAADEDRFLRETAAALEEGLMDATGGLDACGLADADPALARRILVSAWTEAAGETRAPLEARHVERLLGRLGERGGWRLDLPGGVSAVLSCGRLHFRDPEAEDGALRSRAILGPGRYRVAGTPFEILVQKRRRARPARPDPWRITLPWPLEKPLILRGWRPGDRLAGQGARISGLLGRARIPRPLRPRAPVLFAAGEAVWAVGFRAAVPAVRGAALEIVFRECIPGEGTTEVEG